MSDRTVIEPMEAVEIPADVLAQIEEYASEPHHNTYTFTSVQDAVLIKAVESRLSWKQIEEVVGRVTVGQVPKDGKLRRRYEELTGKTAKEGREGR